MIKIAISWQWSADEQRNQHARLAAAGILVQSLVHMCVESLCFSSGFSSVAHAYSLEFQNQEHILSQRCTFCSSFFRFARSENAIYLYCGGDEIDSMHGNVCAADVLAREQTLHKLWKWMNTLIVWERTTPEFYSTNIKSIFECNNSNNHITKRNY